MITGRQRSYLRALANSIEPIFQIGKGGVSDNVIKQFSDALEARELVKATVLKNALVETRDVCNEIAEATGAEVVQVIGSKFVLYKESRESKTIVLP